MYGVFGNVFYSADPSIIGASNKLLFIGGNSMKTKYITIRVDYDSEETWETSLREIEEIMDMMKNLKRKAEIVGIELELKI